VVSLAEARVSAPLAAATFFSLLIVVTDDASTGPYWPVVTRFWLIFVSTLQSQGLADRLNRH